MTFELTKALTFVWLYKAFFTELNKVQWQCYLVQLMYISQKNDKEPLKG